MSALILLAVLLAGCGSHRPIAQQAVQHGDTLVFPDGSSIKLTVSGSRCLVVDDVLSGLVTLDVRDPAAVAWRVRLDAC